MKNWTNAEIVEVAVKETANGIFNSSYEVFPFLDKEDKKPVTPVTPEDPENPQEQHS